MSSASGPVGTDEVALGHAARLLATDPKLAAEQATEILKVVPGQPQALLLLGVARRKTGDAQGAGEVLESLTAKQPNWAAAHYELGLTFGANGKGDAAVTALRRAVELKPDLGDAWRALGDHLSAIGDSEGADKAYAQHIRFSSQNPRLLEAGAALCDNRIAVAEALLREHLRQFPTDVAAIRMLAEVAARLGRMADSETLLRRCLELAPSFPGTRHNLALVLHRQHKPEQALTEINRLLELEPKNPGYRNLKAAILGSVGEYAKSIKVYSEVLAEYPNHAKAWMSYGHALKTAGQQDQSIQAYRKSIEINPGLGETYWSLANLKTFRFSPSDLDTMRAQLRDRDLSDEDRYHFHFAIGKALEDLALQSESFEHYAAGNKLRRAGIRYDAAETTAHVQRSKALFSKEFFAQRAGMGAEAPDPIFIIGLPRAGSTLLEQILSSHPAVEGTMELPDIPSIAGKLGGRKKRDQESKYPEVVAELDSQQIRELGERYLN